VLATKGGTGLGHSEVTRDSAPVARILTAGRTEDNGFELGKVMAMEETLGSNRQPSGADIGKGLRRSKWKHQETAFWS
jgi:hypothetical protein